MKGRKYFPIMFGTLGLFVGIFFIFSISVKAQTNSFPVEINYNFRSGEQGWKAGFAEYQAEFESDYKLLAKIKFMPRKLTILPRQGFYIQGLNNSSDLFMFLKRRLGPENGIIANQRYRIEYGITFASNAPSDCAGIGAPPGEGVILKAGGSSIEPLSVQQTNGYKVMNVDIGSTENDGAAASVAGNIANGIPCSKIDVNSPPFALVQIFHQHKSIVSASAGGDLWLLVGTDSGFFGRTQLYYQNIFVRLIPTSK